MATSGQQHQEPPDHEFGHQDPDVAEADGEIAAALRALAPNAAHESAAEQAARLEADGASSSAALKRSSTAPSPSGS